MNIPADPSEPVSGAANLAAAFDWLADLLRARIRGEETTENGRVHLRFFDDGSALGDFIRDRQPPFAEFIVLLLALAPHVRPLLLEQCIREALASDGDFPEIGGRRDPDSRLFLPTGETAAYLLAGDDLDARFAVQALFCAEHWFARENLLHLEETAAGIPRLCGRLIMARDWVERFTSGHVRTPAFGGDFPARRIDTMLEWDDLVLEHEVRQRIRELEHWVRHGSTLMREWKMAGRLRPGYRALFHGPPGTGKTLTASLLGKASGRDVFRVDLSAVVSKYIGETEKNLAALFDQACNRNWILFFDEADALFGKRSGVKDAHDRYANQEVSYLLQRVEEFDGMVILASNLRTNIDEAFLRRFNAVIRFPFPDESQRAAIWARILPAQADRSELAEVLAQFELPGGGIANVVHFAAIEAIAAGRDRIALQDALTGVAREFEKEGRIFQPPTGIRCAAASGEG